MRIYDFQSTREFIKAWIADRPQQGRGELSRLSKHTRLHSSTLSQILSGTRELSPEQAVSLCEYMALNESETRFFLLLVQQERASSPQLKSILKKQVDEAKEASQSLVQILRPDKKLTLEEQSLFYSSWFYSGVRLLTSLEKYQTREALLQKTGLSKMILNQVVDFLVRTGLCLENAGKLSPGPLYTHLDAQSPLITSHHANWRIKAMEKQQSLNKASLCFSSPMSVSFKDGEQIKKLAVKFIEEVQAIRQNSQGEAIFCLNLDWFDL